MTELWVERTGIRRYTGRSSRGAEVLIGSESDEGVFTPGELLKIALAACSGLSSDHPLRARLGDDYQTTIRVSGGRCGCNNRFDPQRRRQHDLQWQCAGVRQHCCPNHG